jgi:hypothetical protein
VWSKVSILIDIIWFMVVKVRAIVVRNIIVGMSIVGRSDVSRISMGVSI